MSPALAADRCTEDERRLEGLSRDIAVSQEVRQKQQDQIGKEAPPLKIDAWVQGTKLTEDELKGKVLLLDMLSMIQFLPASSDGDWVAHLRQMAEWQKKYADRGLVIIGLTRYSNVRWDGTAQRPVRVERNKENVPPAEEQKLLLLMAKQHGLTWRLAFQDRDNYIETAKHYQAVWQPHLVVIDWQNKIRLIRGGASEQFTREISELLDNLLGTGAGGRKMTGGPP